MERPTKDQLERWLDTYQDGDSDEVECDDCSCRATYGLAREVRALREERTMLMHSEQDARSEIYALRDTIARVEGALEAMRNMRQYAPDRSTAAAVGICARFVADALKPCASSEPDTVPISAPDGQAEGPVVLENPAKQRETLP